MQLAINPGLAVLEKLMLAAGWHSSHRRLSEAAPHLVQELNADDLITTLNNLGVPLSVAEARLSDVEKSDCPSLFVSPSGPIRAILDCKDSQILVCDTTDQTPAWQEPTRERGTLVKLERFGPKDEQATYESFRSITRGFRGVLPWLLVASLMTNLMGLATPLLVMVIYDRVIPTGSVDLVVSLCLAAALVLAADAGFRFARSSTVAYVGRVVEHRLGLALFRKLMSLPLEQVQKSEVEQQISRFKQFEGLRDIFSGQVLTTLLDLPFVLIFLALLFALAPPVGFLIVGLSVVFVLAIWMTLPVQQSLNATVSQVKARQQSYMFETVSQQRSIHRLGLGDVWRERHASLAWESAEASRKARRFQLICQAFAQSLMTIAGVGAIVLSTLSAINGTMTFGALIAVMSLVWKVLTPLQSLYANAPQVAGFLKSKQQVDRVLALPQEMVRGAASTHQKSFEGHIAFTGVTHRFPGATDPAISQVSLEIRAGEFVVIAGNNGSGKTTLLGLIIGLFKPTIGSVQLDGMDLRQIPTDDLRQSFSYAQKNPEIFYGTLLQNFRLASPTARVEDIESAMSAVGLADEVAKFPDGLNTRLSEAYRQTLPRATSNALALARCFARPASVYLLNEPNTGLDYMRKAAVTDHLASLKGHHTIIMISDDPAHIQLADRCIFMASGRVVSNDTGKNGRKKMEALIAAGKES
ncbi:ATP-binding cassette domain-containing protein [Roseobacter sp. YSTF-M11]|uniref:ATP-binding cassette domain-containing protein n=2 Tax=Roseobacter insulae TaxID=2859783 RepID=A0A9X1FX12_9RHOB|nr:ATP-binding cassette domain-containing protein [Roseobacter insulae]